MPCSDQHFIPILDELDQRAKEAEARAASAKRRRGGPRPGSGPPKGNLNALKHGRYSSRHKKLLEALLEVPEARQSLIDMANRDRQRVRKAELEAAYLLMRWLANHNEEGLTAAMDEASLKIQSENDQTRINQMDRALADMEAAFKRRISKNATKKRTPKPKERPNR
jgi:hypothetical protein